MSKCKSETIQAELGTFRHDQAYPRIIQACLRPCVTLAYLEPWYIRTLTYPKPEMYSEPGYIQNPRIFTTLAYSKPKAYSDIYDVKHLR